MTAQPPEASTEAPVRTVWAPEVDARALAVARRLREHRQEIERLFAHRLQQAIPAAQREDRPTLLDHLPQLLDALAQELGASVQTQEARETEKTLSRLHGEQRARLRGYSIEQLLTEYILFRQAIFQVLEQDAPLQPRERDLILSFLQVGAKHAVSQFLHVQVTESRILSWFPANRPTRLLSSVALVIVASAVEWAIWPFVHDSPYVAYYPVMVASAFVADGLVVTVLSALAAQILFLSPHHSLAMGWPNDFIRLALFLFNGTVISMVTRTLRKAQMTAHAAAREQELAKQGAEETSRQLEQEQELRGQFVATLTHDLRGPLSTIHLSAQHLIRFPEKVEMRDVLLQRIVRGADRVDEMIQNLLDVGRIRSGQHLPIHAEPADLAAIVIDVLEELRLVHGGRRFAYTGPPALPGHWSPPELRRLVENLCTNAVKYGSASKPVAVALERRDPWVQLEVWNALANEHPLSAKDLATIFEPYQRTRMAQASAQKGWGLGLTLVKGIAEAHGGVVRARSTCAEGTTFTVLLPLDARPRPEPELPH
ncbi:MAG TPA: sensor histidine kinase [Myxococcaceae bacterium]|jgi:signal transduction histidine kinase